jgi:hypothetical protein
MRRFLLGSLLLAIALSLFGCGEPEPTLTGTNRGRLPRPGKNADKGPVLPDAKTR